MPATPALPLLRPATAADLPAINDIYNHYVLCSTCTYQTVPETMEARTAWFSGRQAGHPVLVAELDGEVVAWGSLSAFNRREAFAWTVENSVYVRHDRHRLGLGRTVLEALLRLAEKHGHHTVIAAISGEQTASIALHERLGFTRAGRLSQAGWKFGQWLDVVYLQHLVDGPASPAGKADAEV